MLSVPCFKSTKNGVVNVCSSHRFTALKFSSTAISILYSCAILLFSQSALAQNVGFADDFSTNTIRYSTDVQNDNGTVSSIEPILGGVRMSSMTDSNQVANARLNINEPTNTLMINGRFDPDSIVLTNDGYTQISIEGTLANDIASENRSDPNSTIGNIYIAINGIILADSSAGFLVCLGRNGSEGFENVNVFDNNTNNCTNYDAPNLSTGDNVNLGYSVGTENVVNLTLGNSTDTITLPGNFFPPVSPSEAISQSTHESPGSGSFLLTSVATDNGTDNFANTTPVIDRYEFNVPGQRGFPIIVDERLRADFTSAEDGGNTVELRIRDVGTYFEATTELSSESTFDSAEQAVGSYIDVVMGNDIQDNGFDGLTGDISANVSINASFNGLRRIEYCLHRYDDANGDSRTGLLNGGDNSCVQLPILAEFDKAYRMAIDFDQTNNAVTFRVNGYTHTENLANLFAAASPRAQVAINGNRGARFVGYIDDIRNSKTALTSIEAEGDGIPTAFPPESSNEPAMLESALDAPYDYSRTPVDFIDDFSSDTSVLGLEQWGEADSSITYSDGAIELQVHSNRDPSDGGGATAFDIRGVSDSITVVGALSSDSRVGPGQYNEISFDVEAIIFNDTVDGGLDEREGDIEAKIRVQMEGNGRRRVQAEYRRRGSDGNNDRLNVFPEGEDRYNFDGFVPQLDTFYTLSLQLDRTNQQLIYSFDDKSISVPIPGGIFAASSNRVQVRAFHRGDSGRAEIRLRSIEIDDQLFDFEQSPPVIAPYRPRYSDEVAGVETTVVNGRLKLEADGRINPGRDPQMRIRGRSTFVGADIELSSDSFVAADEEVFVDVSGLMYSEQPYSEDDSTGRVFAAIRILQEGDGSRYVERCAWRSNDANFNEVDELIGGDSENCTRFETIPELDTAYPVSINLDETAKTLTLSFANEALVYNIVSEIETDVEGFNGVRARTGDNSKVVAYADNLAFSEDPVPLSQSDQNFANVSSDSQNGESGSGNDTAESGGSSGGGGGGCTVGGSGNHLLILLALLALLRLHRLYRRHR